MSITERDWMERATQMVAVGNRLLVDVAMREQLQRIFEAVEAIKARQAQIDKAQKIVHCRSCGTPIRWGVTANERKCPFELDGTSHFKNCPDSRKWSKR